jgi:hypothetical protein
MFHIPHGYLFMQQVCRSIPCAYLGNREAYQLALCLLKANKTQPLGNLKKIKDLFV